MARERWEPPVGLNVVIAVLCVATALNALYWALFFTTGAVQSTQDPTYLAFERAFPAADAWMGVASVLCAIGLRRRQPSAVVYGIAAGSAYIYLGLMDTLYNLENGMYSHLSTEMLVEIGINVGCFVFGPFVMWYVWRQRRWLGA